MAAYLHLGDGRGPSVRIHDEIDTFLREAEPILGVRFDVVLGLDPYGPKRRLTDDEIARLEDEASALQARLEDWSTPFAPEPPATVAEESGREPWGRDGAWRFANDVRALAYVARKYGVPLLTDGD